MWTPLILHKIPKYYCKKSLTEENICILSVFQMIALHFSFYLNFNCLFTLKE